MDNIRLEKLLDLALSEIDAYGYAANNLPKLNNYLLLLESFEEYNFKIENVELSNEHKNYLSYYSDRVVDNCEKYINKNKLEALRDNLKVLKLNAKAINKINYITNNENKVLNNNKDKDLANKLTDTINGYL